MLTLRDNLGQTQASLRAYRMRALLTMLGLMLGVATIITVMTLIQGANLYVEQKIANLGTNVFQVSRVPFAVTDFTLIIKALRNKYLTLEDLEEVQRRCQACEAAGGRANTTGHTRFADRELSDTNVIGMTASMAGIDTRVVEYGRFFTEAEDQRAAAVCVIGSKLAEELFPGTDPLGRLLRANSQEFTVIGRYEKIGSILGQEQDNFIVIPMGAFVKFRGGRFSVNFDIKAAGGRQTFERAQDQTRLILRARRHLGPRQDDDFFVGTAESYISLWQSISSAFFAVFIMVSAISAVVGGIVIMNVMLVSVTERTKEIGVRRAMGATEFDILKQFLGESVTQCLIGGFAGIFGGFVSAFLIRNLTGFPVAVEPWVVALGFALSTGIGLFFGIYPATRAAKLDPVTALRKE